MSRHPRLPRTAMWTTMGLFLGGLACGYSSSSPSNGLGLAVKATTTGANPDPDGYSLSVDGGTGQALAINGTVQLQHLSATLHSLALSGLAANCSVTTANPLQVDMSVTYPTQNVGFSISCP